jgi:hypothetical protein
MRISAVSAAKTSESVADTNLFATGMCHEGHAVEVYEDTQHIAPLHLCSACSFPV